jgi:hypothetical protein
MNGAKRNAYRSLMGKPERKKPLGRPRCRWVDNVKMDLREIEWDSMDWIVLAHDRNTVMNFLFPYNARKFLSSCTIGGFSRRVEFHELVV